MFEPENEANTVVTSAATSKGINEFWLGMLYSSSLSLEPSCDCGNDDCKEDEFKFVYASRPQQPVPSSCKDIDDPEKTFWAINQPDCGDHCKDYSVQGGNEWHVIPHEVELAFICEKIG